jgi:hypothetical protein
MTLSELWDLLHETIAEIMGINDYDDFIEEMEDDYNDVYNDLYGEDLEKQN